MRRILAAPAALSLLIATAPAGGKTTPAHPPAATPKPAFAAPDSGGLSTAYFAGGPFWALEAVFESQPGVRAAVPGYMGGTDSNPTYDKVLEGGTGHFLAVAVRYDARKVSYRKLADLYWRQIDPLAQDRQFLDSGYQFHTALLYRDSAQKREALASRDRAQRRGRFRDSIAAGVEPAGVFLQAEDEQQDYYRKNAGRYRAWLKFSGREEALRRIWEPKSRDQAPRGMAPAGKAHPGPSKFP
jgi:peptide-methionine (S)-S-oxide reductase